MRDKHLKRLNAPNTWTIKNHEKYTLRPKPGAHSFEEGMALGTLLRELLKISQTTHEAAYVVKHNDVLVDGIKRKNIKFLVGLMDTISLPLLKQQYRIVMNKKGKLVVIPITEAEAGIKVCRVNGKRMLGKQIQLSLFDGTNLLLDKTDAKVGDSVLISVPDKKIKEVLPLHKGASVLLRGGKKLGFIAHVDDIKDTMIICSTKDGSFETAKRYAFVLGKGKPSIQVSS